MIALLTLALAQAPAPAPGPDPILAGLEQARSWLLAHQEEDGAWGHWRNPGPYDDAWSNLETHRSWQAAVTGLAVIALADSAEAGPDPPREACRRAWTRGLRFLCRRLPELRRPSDWDTDVVWAWAYGLAALTRSARHPWLDHPDARDLRSEVETVGRFLLERLAAYQTPLGGWAYYADETLARRPYWTTSFVTAVVVLGLLDARELGWPVEEDRLARAVACLEHCRLPNGAYAYSDGPLPAVDGALDIDQVRGSLSRIQVGNLALWRAGRAGIGAGLPREELVRGLRLFLAEHRFLDLAYQRPIPHEAWYFNSGYFYFFGHFYAAGVVEALGPEARAEFGPKVARHLLKVQEADGSMFDFAMNSFGRPYGVAFALSALARLRPRPRVLAVPLLY
ncbi:MAG: hypothetical protein D6702_08605 [Planctomycetota bacterium]|nr:MAG: hypothetical protein D6702_08605 [Planctomycetota bacterium]